MNMRDIHQPIPAKLFVGMLSPDPALFAAATRDLCERYGAVDLAVDAGPWTGSSFYEKEMGSGIVRKFVFFDRLIDQGDLPMIKLFTYELEERSAVMTGKFRRRRINLDPGYVTEAKVVLATTKDYSHRLYIGQGIYAEVTLRYDTHMQSFIPYDHTYMDYRTELCQSTFHKARALLRMALQR